MATVMLLQALPLPHTFLAANDPHVSDTKRTYDSNTPFGHASPGSHEMDEPLARRLQAEESQRIASDRGAAEAITLLLAAVRTSTNQVLPRADIQARQAHCLPTRSF
jgi:hypothetical protein